MNAFDYDMMARALRLAAKGLYTTRPNPTVGCVLTQGERIVGEGFTAPAGGPHAEVAALAAAGSAARGASAYVTLEPCSHFGRTGPCSSALIEAGVARVVCAMLDPNPMVSGGGARALREAGIAVDVGLLEAEARDMNRGYVARMTRGRPWVRSKLAASLDGRTALEHGESQWITGAAARRDVHRWRARSGAVMTGIGTLLADDPSLTARPDDPRLAALQPLRVIVDAELRTPPTARTLALPGQVAVFTTRQETERFTASLAGAAASNDAAWVRIERVPGGERCDLAAVLERLAALEINDVWVEAGAGLNGALLDAGLVDELVLYYAPQLLGDRARGMFAISPPASLAERIELGIHDVRRFGADLRILARPVPAANARRGRG
ncbi:MAG: bifunctional diaminohydroxyphosphoribosylaminopyrimidine deaminase/5-amino-6-(5-phosphoribosylamino)uracil reductase RibD [Gammaproteobacteria bacterium]|nr:bifunctional diaminohydroxyphosphoribosylaminopyrimidine deaminase/5-amino-6-(5-phosphoribosylamino)uracil reductase RibD [Gammaproteobacteria bacterium]